jgi:small subunit ribosomal protein S9
MADKTTIPKYFYGTGRRKTAVARVRLVPNASGTVTINGKTIATPHPTYVEPLRLVGQFGTADLSVSVAGGGTVGQLEAIRHGIARALVELNEDLKTTLKKAGYLTRDPREKERKKPGLKSARRSPQWSKR